MTFLQELETVLKGDEGFVSQDGQLLERRVQDAVNQLNAQLIRQFMAAPVLKEHLEPTLTVLEKTSRERQSLSNRFGNSASTAA